MVMVSIIMIVFKNILLASLGFNYSVKYSDESSTQYCVFMYRLNNMIWSIFSWVCDIFVQRGLKSQTTNNMDKQDEKQMRPVVGRYALTCV